MSEKNIQSLSGTEDRLPWQWELWHRLHDAARAQFRLYGYGELATPIIEDSRLFIKGTGEDTEIVEKQMYTISPAAGAAGEDPAVKAVTLRPEGTPPAIRAYLEANIHKKQSLCKLWYAGPMFRREKPQKGRLRQFHQIGVEAVGSDSPLLDAETILLAAAIYRDAGLTRSRIHINSIGCAGCRPAYRVALKESLESRRDQLCPDCARRLDRNVLRILDCKNDACRQAVTDSPDMQGMLCDGCVDHYGELRDVLGDHGESYQEDPLLVRGLDYYTRTVYEIKHDALGARDTICGGGRYDGLVSLLGGPETPCVGFAMGVEATLIAMEGESGSEDSLQAGAGDLDAYVVCFEDSARSRCFRLVAELREAGLSAEMDYQGRSAKAQMRSADKAGAAICLLIGGSELERNEVTLKNMETGRQWSAPWQEAPAEVRGAVKSSHL